MLTATMLLVWGVVLHLIVDWLFQNHVQATYKSNPRHLAGYLHAGLHALALSMVFPLWAALLLGIGHWIIDLRTPLVWWRKAFNQTRIDNPNEPPFPSAADWAVHVGIGFFTDQVAHVACIAFVALAIGWQWPLLTALGWAGVGIGMSAGLLGLSRLYDAQAARKGH